MVNEVSKLKQQLDGDIVVAGSFQLVHTLLEHDLVDELRLMIYPVVLGTGMRLFGEASGKKSMRLVGNKTVAGDLAYLTYEPVRTRSYCAGVAARGFGAHEDGTKGRRRGGHSDAVPSHRGLPRGKPEAGRRLRA